ncbi:DUF221-domain-containing protein [Punctularia strigosozonata HHB-11173 SS5]|uniref:DUF221-domain-containing protein n=1 Tax=Punctularia strigosozonata (strain HHB-11173) TaxID=741275 RepID=UPI0004417F63|nr:DUF221-domain-containing protein [Punctularia strigosozonata HHB-11173 SS5]EIN13115.1 DUF221-domain-containing protein [Punctularia strigosozonata HHB-11173 SS5]
MTATSNADATGATIPSFLSALTFGVAVFIACITIFYCLHTKYRNIYQPRTFLTPVHKRPRPLPLSFFPWFAALARARDAHILAMNGPDAYFFVRFIRLLCMILIPVWVVAWAVLMPISAIAPNGGQKGLNMFAFGNVPADKQIRHVAHLAVAVVVILYTLFLIYREYTHFVLIRHRHLSGPAHTRLARARTVMLTHLPKPLCTPEALRARIPSPVTHIWFPRSTPGLDALFAERERECIRLEKGEGTLLRRAVKNVNSNKAPSPDASGDAEKGGRSLYATASRFVAREDMPTHRLVKFVGPKVQTLDHSPALIKEQSDRIEAGREAYRAAQRGEDWAQKRYPLTGAAFVRFERVEDAHAFVRDVGPVTGVKGLSAAMEVVPEDVIWGNLGMSRSVQIFRSGVSWVLTIALIVLWAIPVAFVGVVSNVNALCSEVHFLSWICKLPAPVIGIIEGVVPPVLLSILFALLPIILRGMIKLEGTPRHSEVEQALFPRLWLFQIVHCFLIITFSSGLTISLSHLPKTTSDIVIQLATHLPGAGMFFVTYVTTSALTMAGVGVGQVGSLAMRLIRKLLGMTTPREVWETEWGMGRLELAAIWPGVALLGCVSIVYSVIQPVVIGVGAVGFVLLYATYKYLMMYIVDQSEELETGGMYYPRALGTVFVALYLLEACLSGLFFLSTDPTTGGRTLIGLIGGSVMAGTILFTASVQIWMERWQFPPSSYTFLDVKAHLFKSGSVAWLNLALDGGSVAASTTSGSTPPTSPTSPTFYGGLKEEHLAGAQYGRTTGLHATAFDPPSTWKDQRLVWIADDEQGLGLGRAEVRRLRRAGVGASCEWARMDDRGTVEVAMGPPDEAWYGGMTIA